MSVAPAPRHRGVPWLAVQSAVAGVLAYVFFALVTRALGATAAAPVAVLWTLWAFAGAALTFPLQHWITRVVVVQGGEGQVRGGLVRLLGACGVLALGVGLVTWLLREPLFDRDDLVFPALAALTTLGSGVLGIVRGALAARGTFGRLGLSLVVENGLRVVVAGGLAVAGVDRPAAYGLALVGGFAVIGLFLGSLRFSRGISGERESLREVVGFLTGIAGAQATAQLVLTGGPVALALLAAPAAAVTGLFSALALFRAPYTLALGVVSALTAWVAAHASEGRSGPLPRAVAVISAATLVVAGLAAALGTSLGPWAVELVFGSSARLPGDATAVLAVGSALALGSLALGSVVMGLGPAPLVLWTWVVAVVVGAVCFALLRVDSLYRVSLTFLVVELVAFVVLAAVAVRLLRAGGRTY